MTLADTRRAMFSQAKRLTARAYALQLAALILGLWGGYLGSEWQGALAALLCLLWPLVMRMGRSSFADGETLRISELLHDGLGLEVGTSMLAALKMTLSVEPTTYTPEPTFSSKLPAGPHRLVDHLRESAFWTQELARRCAAIAGGITLVLVLTATCVAYAALHSNPTAGLPTLLAGGAVFSTTGFVATAAIKFQGLRASARETMVAAEAALKRLDLSVPDALLLMDRYNRALAISHPIPEWIYNRMRPRIQRTWDEGQQP